MKKIFVLLLIGLLGSCQKEKEDVYYDFTFPVTMLDTLYIGDKLEYLFYVTPEPVKVKMYLEGPLDNIEKKPGDFLFMQLSDSLFARADLVLLREFTRCEVTEENKIYRTIPFSWTPFEELKENKLYSFSVEVTWENMPITRKGKYIYLKENDLGD